MFRKLLAWLRTPGSSRVRPSAPDRFRRPHLEPLEDRFLPAVLTWVGPTAGNDNWNLTDNWSPARIPGTLPGDQVLFAAAKNTDSTMNLGGGVFYHIQKLSLAPGFTSKITITGGTKLFTDVLDDEADGSTITGGELDISQRTDDPQTAATLFEASAWFGGNIASNVVLFGEPTHPLTLFLGDRTVAGTPTIQGNFTVADAFGTVKWTARNVVVGTGKTVTNNGLFVMDSGAANTFGNDTNWTFINNKQWYMGAGKTPKMDLKGRGKQAKVATTTGGPDTFTIEGTYTQDVAAATTDIQSGTLEVDGAVTLSAGDSTVEAGTTLTVSGADVALSSGTMEVYGTLSSDGNFLESGGTATVGNGMSGTVTVSQAYTESGGTLAMVSGTVSAGNGVAVQSGAILTGFGTLMAEVSNAGEVDVSPGATGTLSVTYDYTQTAGTTKIGTAGSSGQARFAVSGALTEQAGTVNFLAPNYLSAGAGYTIDSGASLIGFGTIFATVTNAGTINLTVNSSLNTLQIMGDFTQTSTGSLSLSAPNQITISGQASLDGALTINFVDGYTLQSGQSAKLIGYSSESGSFASVTLPPNTSLSYGASELDLVAS